MAKRETRIARLERAYTEGVEDGRLGVAKRQDYHLVDGRVRDQYWIGYEQGSRERTKDKLKEA
jgi:hypothetical protein